MSAAMILKNIASMQAQLNDLATSVAFALNAEALNTNTESNAAPATPPKKTPKVKDPNAPKKEPNVWVKFTQRVGTLLKTASEADGADPEHFKGPATMVKEFCSMLKGQKPYEAWADSEVLEAFDSWERPVHEPRAKKSSAAASVAASDSGSEGNGTEASGSEGSKKERKKPAPKTEEQKAAIAAKRAATIAAKKAAAGESDTALVVPQSSASVALLNVKPPVPSASKKAGGA
jgi:hypothetical protein